MSGVKTRPITFRVREDLLKELEAAGISPSDVARAALEREAARARKLAVLENIRSRKEKFVIGFDVVDFIRKDRDSHV